MRPVGVAHRDFAATVGGQFRLVYLMRNTAENLITEQNQIECFRQRHPASETRRCFGIEVKFPALQHLPPR